MTETLWYVGGILFIAIGIAVSIGLHEIGHLVPAKKFGVKVPTYAIGFGPTLFKFRRGETEYALKLIPLGGFITMIGMYPPAKKAAKPLPAGKKIGFFADMISQARSAHNEHETPADANRKFYQLPVGKRMVIMFGGPFMNLLLGLGLFAFVLGVMGVPQRTNVIAQVSPCIATTVMQVTDCDPVADPSPAVAAGLQISDEIVAVNGKTGDDAAVLIQALPAGAPAIFTVLRDGKNVDLNLTPIVAMRPVIDSKTGQVQLDESGDPVLQERTVIGVVFANQRVQQGPGYIAEQSLAAVSQVGTMILTLPQQMVQVFDATFGGGERNPAGAVSVVGIGQLAGEVAATDSADITDKLATGLMIIASLNFALFAFNMLPLLPLDGGHIAGGVYEAAKRGIYRLRGKPDPGPADTALLMPATWFVVILLMAMSVLLILADLINPIAF